MHLTALYRHHCGFFARGEGVLFVQDRYLEDQPQTGNNFWQVNFTAGYRFPKQC